MKTRIITGIVMSLILIPIVLLGNWFMVACAALLSYIGTYELIKMHCAKSKLSISDQYIIPLFASMIVILGGFMMLTKYVTLSHLFIALLGIFTLFLIFSIFSNNHKLTDFMLFFGFVLYGGLGVFMAINSRFITMINGEVVNYLGLVLILYLAISTMFTDIGAYAFGLMFGKHKLCPNISPNKTIEGAIGGTLFGTTCGTIFLIIFENVLNFNLLGIDNNVLNIVLVALLSLSISIVGQIGDLIASKLKREYDIKDYGFIFPGHGGVMDRFDSLIISGTFFFLVLSLLGVII